MVVAEKSLLDRYLMRARDHSGALFTKSRLIDRCTRDVAYDGPEARTTVQLKGERGRGLKKHRRLIPNGPLGEIRYGFDGLLSIEFPSTQLLAALDSDFQVSSALARYYLNHAKPAYPAQMTVELAVKFAHENLRVEFDLDVIEALFQQQRFSLGVGNAYSLICDMLGVESKALEMRWKKSRRRIHDRRLLNPRVFFIAYQRDTPSCCSFSRRLMKLASCILSNPLSLPQPVRNLLPQPRHATFPASPPDHQAVCFCGFHIPGQSSQNGKM